MPEAGECLAALEAECAALRVLADNAWNPLLILDGEFRPLAANTEARRLLNWHEDRGASPFSAQGAAALQALAREAIEHDEDSLEEQVTLQGRIWRARVRVTRSAPDERIYLALDDVSELVRLNRARRDMVANISHELRTPIANIRLIIDSLFLDREKPRRKKSIQSLRAIASETDALQRMAEELLDLSMIESGQALMKLQDVPARGIVDSAIGRMTDQCDARELRIANEVPPDLIVLCDADKLRRVLMNLLHNAIKWSPRGEKICIQARRLGEEIEFAVLDRGIGVAQEHTRRIFERFYQIDQARSGGEGTGLGLAICRHIIEAHGGSIRAESSREAGGGRFHFTLPAGAPGREAAPTQGLAAGD